MTSQADARMTTVLLVEDEELIRMTAGEALADEGFQVHEARHAAEAITFLEQNHAKIHILFTDVSMPGEMDGVGLAHHASQHWPWIGLIITSAMPQHMHRPLPEGIRFVEKPYRLSHVIQHVRGLCAP